MKITMIMVNGHSNLWKLIKILYLLKWLGIRVLVMHSKFLRLLVKNIN